MDRAFLEQHLERAAESVADAARRVSEQKQRMALLEKRGGDMSGELTRLTHFEQVYAMFVANRDRLAQRLEDFGLSYL